MNKFVAPFVEALSLYTVAHALLHVIPILIVLALGLSEHAQHSTSHGHVHFIQDTLLLTLASHILLPIFTLYATNLKGTQHLNLNLHLDTHRALLHKH